MISVLLLLSRRAEADPQVLPSLGLAVGIPHGERPPYVNFWTGVSIAPRDETLAPFVAAGVDIDIRDVGPAEHTYTETDIVPVVRGGLLAREKPGAFPMLEAYLLGGYRRSGWDGDAVRVGVGLALPVLLPLAEAGIPTTIEGVADLGERSNMVSLRVGWSF